MTKFDAYHKGRKLNKGDTFSNSTWKFDHVTDDNKITLVCGEVVQTFDRVEGIELKRFAGTIDMTPTWRGILLILLTGYENGNAEGRKMALEELQRMADIADAHNASVKG